MPILNSLAKVVAKPIPRTVSPKAHAIVDYITVGSFLMSAGFFWQRSKRAALAALICGGAELSTRSASLSYYFLLALFPMFLFLVSLVGVFAGPGSQLRESIISGLGRLAPGSASALVESVTNQTFKNSSGIKLAAGILGTLWAASGGMGAVVISLNVIYGVTETRPWWKQKLTIVGLTVTLAALIIVALVLVLYGGKIGQVVAAHIGLGDAFRAAWKVLQWPVSFFAM